jgi:hypothetical protein
MPNSAVLPSFESGLAGCAEVEKTEQGQIVTMSDAERDAP